MKLSLNFWLATTKQEKNRQKSTVRTFFQNFEWQLFKKKVLYTAWFGLLSLQGYHITYVFLSSMLQHHETDKIYYDPFLSYTVIRWIYYYMIYILKLLYIRSFRVVYCNYCNIFFVSSASFYLLSTLCCCIQTAEWGWVAAPYSYSYRGK